MSGRAYFDRSINAPSLDPSGRRPMTGGSAARELADLFGVSVNGYDFSNMIDELGLPAAMAGLGQKMQARQEAARLEQQERMAQAEEPWKAAELGYRYAQMEAAREQAAQMFSLGQYQEQGKGERGRERMQHERELQTAAAAARLEESEKDRRMRGMLETSKDSRERWKHQGVMDSYRERAQATRQPRAVAKQWKGPSMRAGDDPRENARATAYHQMINDTEQWKAALKKAGGDGNKAYVTLTQEYYQRLKMGSNAVRK